MRQRQHGTIKDIISGEEIPNIPEERCVQFLAKWLLSVGYRKEQLQVHPQFKIKRNGKEWPVDIAVFPCEKRDTTPLIIAECKKEKSGTTKGADQLTGYLDRCGARLGIWFDGERMSYIIRIPEAIKCMEASEPMPPIQDSVFGSFLRSKREALQIQDKKYSLRKVASRIGVSPSYLSKVEGGVSPVSNETLTSLAKEFGEDKDELFRKAGRVPEELMNALSASAIAHPQAWREICEMISGKSSEDAGQILKKITSGIANARKVRTGEW